MQKIVMDDGYELTDENYYSNESNKRFMSVHEYLDFAGHMNLIGCESRALAKLNGEWQDEKNLAMQVGSYVDSYFEGTLDEFKKNNPDLFTQKGELKAAYKQADKMIEKASGDELFMKYMSGEKQRIMVAHLFGCDWKIKMDSYIEGVCITDLKTTSSDLHKAWRVDDTGYVSVPEYWGYTLQGAIYQKVVEINTGKKLPFYLAFVTKEDYPEICIVNIDQMTLDNALNEIEMNIASVLAVKNGEVEPISCGKCNYCKSKMKLTHVIGINDLICE
jgi:hypothetical protein